VTCKVKALAMTKKSDLPISVDIAARAEAKLNVKAEVPSKSVGRLVDALTDIIRPFTEARGLKADILRLQREEVAIEIARRGREKVLIEEGREISPVPTKILVPLIEKGSCEDIDDSEMIDRWASLLASAALDQNKVAPRFVGILGELSGSQAVLLERIAFNSFSEVTHPSFTGASD
jgi:Abortive infection alpha